MIPVSAASFFYQTEEPNASPLGVGVEAGNQGFRGKPRETSLATRHTYGYAFRRYQEQIQFRGKLALKALLASRLTPLD